MAPYRYLDVTNGNSSMEPSILTNSSMVIDSEQCNHGNDDQQLLKDSRRKLCKINTVVLPQPSFITSSSKVANSSPMKDETGE